MTINFIYPEIIEKIREICLGHISGINSAEDIQCIIHQGEVTIIAIEENDIREFFMNMEGKLELIKFTIDYHDQLKETKKIANEILDWLLNREIKHK
jgi:hypothetical protein